MTNPNEKWENCDYLLWPDWYAYLTWGMLMLLFMSVTVMSALEQLR